MRLARGFARRTLRRGGSEMRYRALFLVLTMGGLLLGLLSRRPWAAVDEAEAASATVWKCFGFDAGDGVRAAVWVHNDADKNPMFIKVRFLSAGGSTVAEHYTVGL